jgi:hypothetical protein
VRPLPGGGGCRSFAFGCSGYPNDAAGTTEKRSDEGQMPQPSVHRAGLFAGLEQCSLPVNFGCAVARAHAGHTDSASEAGATTTYVRASLAEVATALGALTSEPHPLATTEGW